MKKFLIVNPFGIGDVIFSMVLTQSIRLAEPQSVIGFVCNERTESLVRLNPSIDHTYVFNRDHFRALWKSNPIHFFRELKGLLAVIKQEKYDTLFDLSLGREYSFFLMLQGIKKRIGFDFKGRGLFLTHKKKLMGYENEAVVHTQLKLLSKAGIAVPALPPTIPIRVSQSVQNDMASLLKQNSWVPGQKILAMAPGGGRSWGKNAIYKQWDWVRFAETVNKLQEREKRFVVVLGDDVEKGLLNETAKATHSKHLVFAGQPIENVCAALMKSDLFIGNDGGLLHLANALGCPTVSIYGPVDEKVYGPVRVDVPSRVLVKPVPCRPCYRRFKFPPCPHNRRCLDELLVEEVVEAARQISYH